jgi:hypothetical protein
MIKTQCQGIQLSLEVGDLRDLLHSGQPQLESANYRDATTTVSS